MLLRVGGFRTDRVLIRTSGFPGAGRSFVSSLKIFFKYHRIKRSSIEHKNDNRLVPRYLEAVMSEGDFKNLIIPEILCFVDY